MKIKLLLLCLAFYRIPCTALSTIVYFASAVKGNNEVAASALYGVLEDKYKKTALEEFKKAFNKEPQIKSGLTAQDRENLIKQASAGLQKVLSGKDLNDPNALKEVLEYIGGPQGSGGKLAQQLGKAKIQPLIDALQRSAP